LARDYAAAVRRHAATAETGLAEVQFNLGYLHERGLGVKKNGSQAVVWCRRAALQGIAESYRSLGMLFTKDGLVERNDAKALFWLSLSEDDPQAQQVIKILRKRSGDAALRAAQKVRDEWKAKQR
jgi:TPR repeat protein